jgi:hypothetical protein
MKKENYLDSFDRTEDTTPEEVRQFEKFKNYTDEELGELMETIRTYVRFIYHVCSKRKKNGRKIALHIENEKLKAA